MWKCCSHIYTSYNTGHLGSVHSSGRGTPDSGGNVDTSGMLHDLDVQPPSKPSLCTSSLATETSTPEQPFTTNEVSHELDHEAIDSPSPGLLLHPDDAALSGQHPDGNESYELAPVRPSDTSAPLLRSHSEDAVTLATSEQGKI